MLSFFLAILYIKIINHLNSARNLSIQHLHQLCKIDLILFTGFEDLDCLSSAVNEDVLRSFKFAFCKSRKFKTLGISNSALLLHNCCPSFSARGSLVLVFFLADHFFGTYWLTKDHKTISWFLAKLFIILSFNVNYVSATIEKAKDRHIWIEA